MRKMIALLLTFVLIFTVGCSEVESVSETGEEAITFTDDLGREVTVSNPKRVATLLGSFADVWFLAGGSVCASADDAWDNFQLDMPEDAVNLGQTKNLNLELLLSAEPDFIIASANTKINMEWKEIFEDAGIPTAYFDVSNFEDYMRMFKICTDITGREDLYEKYGLDLQEQIDNIIKMSEKRIEKEGAPKVLNLRVSAASVHAKNSKGNVLGKMLKTLGCENIADNDESLLENISVEHILQQDPDFIFFVQHGDDQEATQENIDTFIKENPVWQELSAVKEGRVYIMEKSLYNLKPNGRWAEAYENLEGILSNEKE